MNKLEKALEAKVKYHAAQIELETALTEYAKDFLPPLECPDVKPKRNYNDYWFYSPHGDGFGGDLLLYSKDLELNIYVSYVEGDSIYGLGFKRVAVKKSTPKSSD